MSAISVERDRMQLQIDWLRFSLEEIVRCTEPKAGNGDKFICGIAWQGLQNAGFSGPASVAKPKDIILND